MVRIALSANLASLAGSRLEPACRVFPSSLLLHCVSYMFISCRRLLGAVYKQRERFDQASDCLLTSLELEEGAPLLSPSQVVPAVLY